MSKGAHDIFTIVINFKNRIGCQKHITIGLFEASKALGQALANNLKNILEQYGLTKKSPM
jgi:hypothetical protein